MKSDDKKLEKLTSNNLKGWEQIDGPVLVKRVLKGWVDGTWIEPYQDDEDEKYQKINQNHLKYYTLDGAEGYMEGKGAIIEQDIPSTTCLVPVIFYRRVENNSE